MFLIGGKADKHVVIRFGIPAFVAAFGGAFLLLRISNLAPLTTYSLFGNEYSITPVKLIIACLVDVSRLGVYMTRFLRSGLQENITLVIAATLSAFAGAYAGNILPEKVTLRTVQVIVTVMLTILSIILGLGII